MEVTTYSAAETYAETATYTAAETYELQEGSIDQLDQAFVDTSGPISNKDDGIAEKSELLWNYELAQLMQQQQQEQEQSSVLPLPSILVRHGAAQEGAAATVSTDAQQPQQPEHDYEYEAYSHASLRRVNADCGVAAGAAQ